MKFSEIPKEASITIAASYEDKKIVFEAPVKLAHDNMLLVPTIKYNDKTVGFNENFMLDLYYTANGHLYRFPDVKVTLVRYQQTLFHRIETENEGKIYNRRGDYRVYIGKPMHLTAHQANGTIDYLVTLKDISLSGFAFISKEEFRVERTVHLKFRDESLVMDIPAKIVRADWNEHLRANVYGCQMIDSYPALGRYLIAKQREILQRTRAANSKKT